MYQITFNTTGGALDNTGTPIASVLGPNGENKTTLENAGWTFSVPTSSRITITRPNSKQVQPLVNILTHGVNGNNVYSVVPSGHSTITYSAIQTLSSGSWTTLDIYAIGYGTAYFAQTGASTYVVTFGLIS
jgi:hypothetical protein